LIAEKFQETTRELPCAVAFLGNPGREFTASRHNFGFQLASVWQLTSQLVWQSKFKGLWAQATLEEGKVFLLQPQTFMNLAGESLRAAGEFFKLPADGWIVVHDDLELGFGEIRMQRGGGLGGHNGLRSVKQHLGTDQFYRLRLGIGRPTRGDVAAFVLGNFSREEVFEIPRVLARAGMLLESTLREGFPSQSASVRKPSS